MAIDDLDKLMFRLQLSGRGLFINESDFPDQLTKKNEEDAGLDIKAVLIGEDVETVIYGPTGETYLTDVREIVIPAKGRACINAMVRTKITEGHYGKLASRSGLSKRFGLEVGAGTVDAGYRGLISVVLHNHGFYDYVVLNGDKIAQLITIKIDSNPYIEVSDLDVTERGSGGFGSSGR